MHIFLNYPITNAQKYYKGSQCLFSYIEKDYEGKFNRETIFDFNSHMGTHVDFPAHFFRLGSFGDSYPPEFFIACKVVCVDFDLLNSGAERLTVADFEKFELPSDVDMILVKTGFCSIRTHDQYWAHSPVVESDVPIYLREKFKFLKFVGFDIISLTSQLDKNEGGLCHKNFLSADEGEPILVLEDMDLNHVHNKMEIETIYIAPMLFENMDGSPCTVFAKVRSPEEATC